MRRMTCWMCGLGIAAWVAGMPALAADEFHPDQTTTKSAQDPMDSTTDDPHQKQMQQPGESMQQPDTRKQTQQGSVRNAGAGEYVVEKGDTLAEIAEQQLGDAREWKVIARANGIDDPKTLRVGQKLEIPRDGSDSPNPSMGESPEPSQTERPQPSM